MIKDSKHFTEYLKYNIYEGGEELTDEQFNMLSDEQKVEYCELLEKCYIEDIEYNDDSLEYWHEHPMYIWYSAFKREQQIKTILDD